MFLDISILFTYSFNFLNVELLFFNFNFYFILLYNTVLVLPYLDMNPPQVYMCSPSGTPLPPHTPTHPSGLSQFTGFEFSVPCIKPGLVICFTYGNIHVSMLLSQIIPPLPSPRVQKSVLYIFVSFAVSHIGSSLPSF